MRYLKRYLLYFIPFLVLPCLTAFSQSGAVRGVLLLSDGTPAAYATISVDNAPDQQTAANARGEFLIPKLADGQHLLHFRMVGHEESVQPVEIKDGGITEITGRLNFSSKQLQEVVVTGQSGPQSLRQSVYQVRTISSERIRLRGATNVTTILNTELGIRFENDMALGTTDIELLGMSGQNVKILLDGIPLPDRSEIRESLGQIDINTIERIEIVEGPMSVIYGTDALAGVINIITKKGNGERSLAINARIQEETANTEYDFMHNRGVHNENLSVTWQHRPWQFSAGVTRNNFGGWQGASTGRAKAWMPKDQLLTTAMAGYRTNKMNLWYRFNGTDESLNNLGDINSNRDEPERGVATDKKYTTWRWFHQVQGEFTFTPKLTLSVAGSYTDYSRKTQTINTEFPSGKATLNLGEGAQDKNSFNVLFTRAMVNFNANPSFILTGGLEYTHNEAMGPRIQGTPTISDYALFFSPELRLANQKINLRPGVRLIHNSVYDAPPVIPSLNIKTTLGPKVDLRMAYARGFRAPALRELYFWFFDSSHDMKGNPDLKAESSDSFNAFLNFNLVQKTDTRFTTVIGGFYNHFRNRIDLALDPNDLPVYSYFNIYRFKTTGANLNSTLFWKSLQATLGAQWTGTYNELSETDTQSLPEFNWSPEVNFNLIYSIEPIKTSINLSYKFTGVRPGYEEATGGAIQQVKVDGYHMADISANKAIGKYLTLNAGVRNLLDVTNLRNTATQGDAHSVTSSKAMSYGRSYFIGLAVNWYKAH